MNCPRCNAGEEHLRIEHQGREGDELLWTVYYCRRCCFTWRDSEPAETIDPAQRDPWFRVDPERREEYRQNIPPSHSHVESADQ